MPAQSSRPFQPHRDLIEGEILDDNAQDIEAAITGWVKAVEFRKRRHVPLEGHFEEAQNCPCTVSVSV